MFWSLSLKGLMRIEWITLGHGGRSFRLEGHFHLLSLGRIYQYLALEHHLEPL
jgi:hypothetical protein